jgi:hypothetical protein
MDKKPRVEFGELFPAMSKEGINILERLLRFSLYKRMTICECLNRPYFKDVHKQDHEKVASNMLNLDLILKKT